MHLLLSPDGIEWDADGYGVRRYLGYFGGRAELAALAVRQFGFADLRFRRGDAVVRLDAERFTFAGYVAVLRALIRVDPRRIMVECGDPTVPQLFDNLDDAAAFLDALRGLTPGERPRAGFYRETLGLERLRAVPRGRLAGQYRSWLMTRGRLGRDRFDALLRRPLDADRLLTRRDRGGRVISETWPSYLTYIIPDELGRVLGRAFEDHPAAGGYVSDASAAYREIYRDELPSFELVEALISVPGGMHARVRYERLFLPWRSPGGDLMVSSTALVRSRRAITG